LNYRLWVVKWEYIDIDTNRRRVIETYVGGSTRSKAVRKKELYKRLYETTVGTKLKMIVWKELNLNG